MGAIYQRKYGVATTVDFCLYELDGTDLQSAAVHVAGDTKIMKDEAAEANTASAFVDEGQGYSLALSAAEMTAARAVIYIVDQTNPKAWLDRVLVVETYGDASAQHAFDLDTATVNLSAASEAQIDAIETDTNEIQGKLPTNKIMGSSVVTDKDDEIDAIKVMTDKIGTITNTGGTATIGAVLGDVANSAIATRLTTIDDFLDTEVAAILADTNELQTDWANDGRLDVLIDVILSNTGTIEGYIDTEIAAIKAVTDTLSLAGIADAVLDEVVDVNNPANVNTLRKVVNVMSAATAGKLSGAGTGTLTFRDLGNTKDRITATVDALNNRTAVTQDGT